MYSLAFDVADHDYTFRLLLWQTTQPFRRTHLTRLVLAKAGVEGDQKSIRLIMGKGRTSNEEETCRTACGSPHLSRDLIRRFFQKPSVLLDRHYSRGEWLERQSSHCLRSGGWLR
jgi:hypothetical protein